jgi:uncharacterized protein YyaL (SSP411 family)
VRLLGERDAALFSACYDVTPRGNWEGKTILREVMSAGDAADRLGIDRAEAAAILERCRATLFAAREGRIHPATDDKVLTAWNGMMLAALAECGAALNRDGFVQAATRNADFVLSRMRFSDPHGRMRLHRTYRHLPDPVARLNGYLEDYACYADGLLRLYEATFEMRWLETAQELVRTAVDCFADEESEGFFSTSDDHEPLIQRPKDRDDNATPSGNSVILDVMLRLSALTGDAGYRDRFVAPALRSLSGAMERHPYGFARLLGALDMHLAPPQEVVIAGEPHDPSTRDLLAVARRLYAPNRVVALADPSVPAPNWLPILTDRTPRNGKPTAYVCTNVACGEPVTDPHALAAALTGQPA